jgi:hypothetical protein
MHPTRQRLTLHGARKDVVTMLIHEQNFPVHAHHHPSPLAMRVGDRNGACVEVPPLGYFEREIRKEVAVVVEHSDVVVKPTHDKLFLACFCCCCCCRN